MAKGCPSAVDPAVRGTRRVIDGWDISEVRIETSDYFYQSDLYHGSRNLLDLADAPPVLCDRNSGLGEVVEGPWFDAHEHVDIAAFRVNHVIRNGLYIPLGHQLDEWCSYSEFRLTRALVMGYPPIPFARTPELVAVSCEINSVVELPGLHFILSATARGGFSGGVAISEYGFALGIITQSLTMDYKPAELGFFATTSTEDIYRFLYDNSILPKCQLEGIEDIWPHSESDEDDPREEDD
jgi:hypothetical protein